MHLTIHKLEIWPMSWPISTHFPLSSQLLGCLPFRPEHYTKNTILWYLLVLAKRLQSKFYLKVGSSLGIVWYIIFLYPYLAISNHVLVSYMTSFLAFILVTNSYLLILWLLPHNQINMTFYYVDVFIQKLKRFELTQAYSLYHIRWYAFK